MHWQAWLTVVHTAVYFYTVCLSLFGVVHCVLMMTDLRTKDVLTRKDACAQCCAAHRKTGRRRALLSAWYRQWCGPVRWRQKCVGEGLHEGLLPAGPWHADVIEQQRQSIAVQGSITDPLLPQQATADA